MELYVVTCQVEGCHECGNTYRVIGIFTDEKQAKEVEVEHGKISHLHRPSVDTKKLTLNEVYHLTTPEANCCY